MKRVILLPNLSNCFKKHVLRNFIIICIIIIFTIVTILFMNKWNLVPKKYFSAKDFDIKTIYSSVDFDDDDIDDYSDFLLGARKDAENHPTYISKYYADSYPPDNEGACTDVIWRAFKNAGYSLRDMVDNDIKEHPSDYPNIEYRDKNIDFRRVNNLRVFFSRYATSLTLDYTDIKEWQPGDIVFLNDNHVGMISDRRNDKGYTYIIHNGGQPNREEDVITNYKITGHYRFDASKIDAKILVSFK